MKVLSGSISVLIHSYLYKKEDWRISHKLLNIMYLVPMVLNVILMANRIFVELRNGGGFKEISYAFYIGLGAVSAICIYASLAMHYKLIIALVDLIEEIVEYRVEESDVSRGIYTKIDNDNKHFVKKISLFIIYVIITTDTIPILSPIGYAIFGFPSPQMWFFPFPIAVWWDTTHPLGFYIALIPQIGCTVTYMMCILIMITFFSGICTFIGACVDDLSTIVPQMNETAAKCATNGSNQERIELQLQLRHSLTHIIKLHSNILDIIEIFRVIVSGPIFFQLLVYVLFLALNLLQFDKNFDGFSLAMALNVNALINQIIFNYVTCNYSTNVMEKVNTIADIVFDMNWYELTAAEQKLAQKFLPLAIQRTQKPVRLTGYGIITSSRETFLMLLKSSVSYFIVLRRFS